MPAVATAARRRPAASRSARCWRRRIRSRRSPARRPRPRPAPARQPLDLKYAIRVAALDTTNDDVDELRHAGVLRRRRAASPAGPFAPPSTGPAYVKFGGENAPFFFDGSGAKVGAAYFVSQLAPDLSVVRFARYGANFIPRNAPVLADVDDINNSIGFWRPQADFRIPGADRARASPISPTSRSRRCSRTWSRPSCAIRPRSASARSQNHPDADLVMVYIEQPDGSEHQFLLTDPRQGTNPKDPNSIGANQDPAKVARYAVLHPLRLSDGGQGRRSEIMRCGRAATANVIVVSDHGFAPFHTSVSMTNILKNARHRHHQGRRSAPQVRRPTSTSTCRARVEAAPSIRRPTRRWWRRSPPPCRTRPIPNPTIQRLAREREDLHGGRDPSATMRRRARAVHQQDHRPGFRRCVRADGAGLQFRRHPEPRRRPPRRSAVQRGDDRAVDAQFLRRPRSRSQSAGDERDLHRLRPRIRDDVTIRRMRNLDVAPTIMHPAWGGVGDITGHFGERGD